MNRLRLAIRLLRRDFASGELTVLFAALVLAVAAVTTVGFVADRADRALQQQANQLLGGDAVVRGDQPLPQSLYDAARAANLNMTRTVLFSSMVRFGESAQFSEVKAMAPGFPLRGAHRIVDRVGDMERDASEIPRPGTLWVSEKMVHRLGVVVGDSLKVGSRELCIAAIVTREPDNALDYFNVAPRVFMHLDDLASTGLIQEGSRASHRLVVAGPVANVERFVANVKPQLARGQRLETIRDARPEVRAALERAEKFLNLAALVSVVLAAVAVAMAARRHTARHLDGCAVMRCLGASQGDLFAIHFFELALAALMASAIGVVAGLAIQSVLLQWLSSFVSFEIPAPSILPALQGAVVGVVLLLGFAVPPLIGLRGVPALRVIRRDSGRPNSASLVATLLGFCAIAALMLWKAGELKLAGIMVGGLAGAMLALALVALALIVLVARLRGKVGGAWRYGLANLRRRSRSSIVQVVAIGLGIMAILLLTVVRTDLLSRWRDSLPPDAPNRFVINVQPEQVAPVREFFADAGLKNPGLYPMIRGRLTAVNGKPVSEAQFSGERAKRLAEREFNLSWARDFRPDNKIVAGSVWKSDTSGLSEFSVEEGIAQTLGWKLGDKLTFDIAGRAATATITSLRKVDWESFQPNFFVVAAPGTLDDYPASFITSLHVPKGSEGKVNELVGRFPNVSVIDVGAIRDQVRNTTEQVSKAIEYVFYFTLVAGVLVLFGAIAATQDERLLESGVMRVLGARRGQVVAANLTEFAAMGLVAGLTAAVAATVVAWAVSTEALNLAYRFDPIVPLLGALAGVLGVTLFGALGARRVLSAPPAATLRALS